MAKAPEEVKNSILNNCLSMSNGSIISVTFQGFGREGT